MKTKDFKFDKIDLEIFGNGIFGNGLSGNGISSIDIYNLDEILSPIASEMGGNGF